VHTLSTFRVVHRIGERKEAQPVAEGVKTTERIRRAGAVPAEGTSRFARQDNSRPPAFAEYFVQSVYSPDGQEVDDATAIHPYDVVRQEMLGHVRHVRPVEQGQM